MIALQVNSTRGAVSSLNPPVVAPVGSADTITNSLVPFPNSGVRGGVYAAASTGNIPDYNEASCLGAGIQPDGQDYASTLVSAGLKGVPVVGSLLSSVAGVFGAHHAAAVKQEQAILCANVPGIQAFLAERGSSCVARCGHGRGNSGHGSGLFDVCVADSADFQELQRGM